MAKRWAQAGVTPTQAKAPASGLGRYCPAPHEPGHQSAANLTLISNPFSAVSAIQVASSYHENKRGGGACAPPVWPVDSPPGPACAAPPARALRRPAPCAMRHGGFMVLVDSPAPFFSNLLAESAASCREEMVLCFDAPWVSQHHHV